MSELLTIADTPPDVLACCSPLAREPLGAEAAVELAGLLKAIADPTRLRLLSLIQAHEDGEACVCDLTAPVGLSQPTAADVASKRPSGRDLASTAPLNLPFSRAQLQHTYTLRWLAGCKP